MRPTMEEKRAWGVASPDAKLFAAGQAVERYGVRETVESLIRLGDNETLAALTSSLEAALFAMRVAGKVKVNTRETREMREKRKEVGEDEEV